MNPTTNTEGAVTDVAAIAKGLTKGELARLPLVHPDRPTAFASMQGRIRVALFCKGLLERARDVEEGDDPLLFRLTPLGLAVRNHLTEQGVTAS